MSGRLFVVSGPAGAGKGTVLKQVMLRRPDLALSVSATTRAPREGEIDGVHYYFMDDSRFDELVEAGEFLEWAEVHGNKYGTPAAPVREMIARGSSTIVEIDPQGAFAVRSNMPDCVLVFIAAPSMETLRQRLVDRGSETPETLERRMADAVAEMEASAKYDEIVVNDDLDTCVNEVLALIERYEND